VHAISGEEAAAKLINRMAGVAEAVIPQRSSLIGMSVYPGMVTSPGDLVVMAVQRRGEDLVGEVTLEAGTMCWSRGHGRRSRRTSRGAAC
jgi:hypothetical protein